MEKLPSETNDKIIDASLRHVLLAFGGLITGTLAVGTGIVSASNSARHANCS